MSNLEGEMIISKSGISWEQQTTEADVPTQATQAGYLAAAAFAALVGVM